MADKVRRKKTRRKSKLSSKNRLLSVSNLTIFLLGITSIAFVGSVLNRHMRGGIIIQDFRLEPTPPELNLKNYDDSLLSNIEVEVLNGCGISGIAQQFTEYLRDKHIDVIRTENADNFHYDKTMVILRRGDFEQAKQVAKLLEISPHDSIRVMVAPDGALLTDITIVVGSDYINIGPVQRFLATQL